jgi:hypothetical protein
MAEDILIPLSGMVRWQISAARGGRPVSLRARDDDGDRADDIAAEQ